MVGIDILIALLFTLAIFRLKYYEYLSDFDMKHGQRRIEDFTVQMNSIPIKSQLYNNDPDLLNAILFTHFEDVIAGEQQVFDELEDN